MNRVLSAIPHRPPFLFVDEIIEIRDDGITCRRTLRENESFYAGHYPGNPVTPGVLLCESVFQAAAIYLSGKLQAGGTPVLCRIENARFKNMVFPGDILTIEVVFVEKMQGFYFMSGKVICNGKTALTIKFALTVLEQTKTV
ncbi:MAG: beta-hydroxyacyl-ACP dehydratase [Puniceicoccales bacterium]|jgi:3-hydroxyacyl-[acyl-carrier-protein] dehydratase|nr:beta-hydroxyacyl-ACP dehydratase [Puniceicoccales bacterium]